MGGNVQINIIIRSPFYITGGKMYVVKTAFTDTNSCLNSVSMNFFSRHMQCVWNQTEQLVVNDVFNCEPDLCLFCVYITGTDIDIHRYNMHHMTNYIAHCNNLERVFKKLCFHKKNKKKTGYTLLVGVCIRLT